MFATTAGTVLVVHLVGSIGRRVVVVHVVYYSIPGSTVRTWYILYCWSTVQFTTSDIPLYLGNWELWYWYIQ